MLHSVYEYFLLKLQKFETISNQNFFHDFKKGSNISFVNVENDLDKKHFTINNYLHNPTIFTNLNLHIKSKIID